MKKLSTIILLCALFISATAQTMYVCKGSITTAFTAKADEMPYSNGGKTVTIDGISFNTENIDSIYVDDSVVEDNTVYVEYQEETPKITIAGNIATLLTTKISDANVCILQDPDVNQEITYILSGKSQNGSFYMAGEFKATIRLQGLELTSNDSAAINIRNGKRITVELTEGTTSKLSDASNGSHKGCFMVNGHTEFKGGGSLVITGNTKHAFWGDEYVELKKTTGNITINRAMGDGMNINQYFHMKGGTLHIDGVADEGIAVSATDDATDEQNGEVILEDGTAIINVTSAAAKGIKCEGLMTISGGEYTITTSGNGIYDTEEKDTKASACLKSNGNMVIDGGSLTLKSSGTGGKGASSDGELTIAGGTICATTTGTRYTYSSSLRSSAKGIKSDGILTITGGTINVKATGGEGSEGIESKSVLNIDGGEITITSYDDGVNSKGNLTINNGLLFAQAAKNDALDANQNIYINGGKVIAIGASSPECAIDAAERYSIFINGGYVVGIGGSTAATSSSSKQASVSCSATVSKRRIGLFNSAGTGLLYFEVPETNCKAVYITTNGMPASQNYTLKYDVSVNGGSTWNGLNTDGTITGGTNLSSATSALAIGNSSGGGGRPGRP